MCTMGKRRSDVQLTKDTADDKREDDFSSRSGSREFASSQVMKKRRVLQGYEPTASAPAPTGGIFASVKLQSSRKGPVTFSSKPNQTHVNFSTSSVPKMTSTLKTSSSGTDWSGAFRRLDAALEEQCKLNKYVGPKIVDRYLQWCVVQERAYFKENKKTFASVSPPTPSFTSSKTTASVNVGSFASGKSSTPASPGFSFGTPAPAASDVTATSTPPATNGFQFTSASTPAPAPVDTPAANKSQTDASTANSIFGTPTVDDGWELVETFASIKLYRSNAGKLAQFANGDLLLQKLGQKYRFVMYSMGKPRLNMVISKFLQESMTISMIEKKNHPKQARLNFSGINSADRGIEPFVATATTDVGQACSDKIKGLKVDDK